MFWRLNKPTVLTLCDAECRGAAAAGMKRLMWRKTSSKVNRFADVDMQIIPNAAMESRAMRLRLQWNFSTPPSPGFGERAACRDLVDTGGRFGR